MTALDQHPGDLALEAILEAPAVCRATDWLSSSTDRFIKDLITLSEIPAPTFHEQARAEHVRSRLEGLGLAELHQDAAGNVIGVIAGRRSGLGVAFMAHLDTVFPHGTDVRVRQEGSRLHGPGIGDNGAGLAGLLHMVESIRAANLQPERPIWVVASTGEEGLGDLCGARAAVAGLRDRASEFIAIEGALLGRVTHEAVGSLRWRVRFTGPGGHSWHDFGRPSPVMTAARAIAELGRLTVPSQPRTTYNVGRIEGGIGVNVIPSEASMLLDMRSTDAAALAKLVGEAERLIRRSAEQDGVSVSIEAVGDRPAGSIPRNHALSSSHPRFCVTLASTRGTRRPAPMQTSHSVSEFRP